MPRLPGLLHFREEYVERIWGGRELETRYGKRLPPGKQIGEAWLISDHPTAQSVVDEGELAGQSLRQLIERDKVAVLGTRVSPTPRGLFPLLLKLLDCRGILSVQVHPDDACAAKLGETDVGKTEMWHVLDAAEESTLICGLKPSVGKEQLEVAVRENTLESLLEQFPVKPGDSVLVPAGVVHAIAPGVMLAEIQENSDLTYRLYDWGRLQKDGKPRELHVEKALAAIHFGCRHPGKTRPLELPARGGRRRVIGACSHFAAELVTVDGDFESSAGGGSFHIVLATQGSVKILSGSQTRQLAAGEAVLVSGESGHWGLNGIGEVLDFYVPVLEDDIVRPLAHAGYSQSAIDAVFYS